MKRVLAQLVLFVALFVSRNAWAHKPSDSYLTLTVDGSAVHGRWDIALRDLAYALDVDTNHDGKITWAEVQAAQPTIATYALGHLALSTGDAACTLEDAGNEAIVPHSDGTYAVLHFEAKCTAKIAALGVDYRLFFELDAQHRGLLRFEGGASQARVFSATDHVASFDLADAGKKRQFANIVGEGIIHIWKGYDHVLFLLALLLPAVLRRRDGVWEPVGDLRTALLDVLRIVTAFTIAHSITLSLAALGVVTLPSRLVESAIALSVVLAALNNVYPILREDRWAAAFLLGLMHGFGFSATLMDLDLPRANLVLTLFGFNVGVEIGQLAIVLVFVPLAFALRKQRFYQRGLLVIGSLVILVLASIWLVERAFEVRVIS